MKKCAFITLVVVTLFTVLPAERAEAQWLWWKKDKTEATNDDSNARDDTSIFNRQKTDRKAWTLPFAGPKNSKIRQYRSQTLQSLESYGLNPDLAPAVALDKIANLDNARQVAEQNVARIESAKIKRQAEREQKALITQAALLKQQALEAKLRAEGKPISALKDQTVQERTAPRTKIRPFIPKSNTERTDTRPRRLFNIRE